MTFDANAEQEVKGALPWLQEDAVTKGLEKKEDGKGKLLLRIVFKKDQVDTTSAPKGPLDKIVSYMKENDGTRIIFQSYASKREGHLSEARRVSLKRALSVRNYIIGKGVDHSRIIVKALGDTLDEEPLDRIDIILL